MARKELTKGDDFAFASRFLHQDQFVGENGLTKREYFAAIAMQGILANHLEYDDVAKTALALADGLIEELNK